MGIGGPRREAVAGTETDRPEVGLWRVKAFPAEAASVRAARRYVQGLFAHELPSEVLASLVLMVSELATNAVQYGGGAGFELRVGSEHLDGLVRIEIQDMSPRSPSLQDRGLGDGRGRGLRIVDHFADRWGWEPRSSGKVTWFEVTPSSLG